MKKPIFVKFDVRGKPPRKHDNQSIWSHPKESRRVILLREKALESSKGMDHEVIFIGPVRLELVVFAPNILERNYKQIHDDDPQAYVGDLDSFVAGVCESLKPNLEVKGGPEFEGRNDISPSRPLIIDDDSQIVSIKAEKRTSEDIHYTVTVEPI